VNEKVHQTISALLRADSSTQFWMFQIAGWACLSVVSYFSLNLWYDQPELSYLAHNLLQSVLGVLVSSPLRLIYRRVWNDSMALRTVYISIAVLLFASLWSVLRLALFQAITGETGLWSDFGGWLFPSIFIFMCWTALYHGFKYYRLVDIEHAALLRMASDRNNQAAKAAQAESTAREAQLEMLRYQLNPHFLFNTLNAVQSLVATQQTRRATEMIAALSEFLRYSLYTDSKKLVSVDHELDALRMYLLIEQARFGERLKIKINASEDAREQQIPSMLLQPLVENAIKYAIARSEKGGTLEINAYCADSQLNIDVRDSGAQAEQPTVLGAPGVGLRNIQRRLEAYYGDAQCLELQPLAAGGMQASIRLPLGPFTGASE
jgi:two-component sensor histidine kinase